MLWLRSKKGGFTLVEIMIVVAIIGLLAAIAIPNFMEARRKAQESACKANLKQIEGAVQQYMLDNRLSSLPTGFAVSTLVPTYIKRTPTCPAGGTYSIDANGDPSCTVTGHTLP